ncbi:MAG: hypothetical protein V3V30_04440 [Parvularculaceae bacterium]
MNNLITKAAIGVAGLVAIGFTQANAAIVTYADEATFLAAAAGQTVQLFDAEAPDFPLGNNFVGVVNGVGFDADIIASGGGQRFNGVTRQDNSGANVDNTVLVDFSAYAEAVFGFGYYDTDLTGTEISRVTVNFADASQQVFEFGLNGNPNFTETFFGMLGDTTPIISLVIAGRRDGGAGTFSAFSIDNLFVVSSASAVPLPAAAWFMGAGIAGYITSKRKKKSAKKYS